MMLEEQRDSLFRFALSVCIFHSGCSRIAFVQIQRRVLVKRRIAFQITPVYVLSRIIIWSPYGWIYTRCRKTEIQGSWI
uniref:Uncharacterized protein n=1 Tax=Arundo donax TaxID=35708 RepID=A0A0A9G9P5_ARUDO